MTTGVQQQEDLIDALFKALFNDGFATYLIGPKDRPTAIMCVYEWPKHFDVIVFRLQGDATAVRVRKPVDLLNPTEADQWCEWAFVGPPDSAMWALLDRPHPDHSTPDAQVRIPETLWIPRDQQREGNMHVRLPDQDKAGVRAARLSQAAGPQVLMSEAFFNDLLDEVDNQTALGFASYFTERGVLRWGNFKPVVGRTAITEFTQSFFTMISSVRHELDPNGYHLWVEDRYATTRGKVTFTRLDGSTVTVPFGVGAYFTPDGLLMESYTVNLDPSPLVGVTIPVDTDA